MDPQAITYLEEVANRSQHVAEDSGRGGLGKGINIIIQAAISISAALWSSCPLLFVLFSYLTLLLDLHQEPLFLHDSRRGGQDGGVVVWGTGYAPPGVGSHTGKPNLGWTRCV